MKLNTVAYEQPNLTIVLRELFPCGWTSTDTSEGKQVIRSDTDSISDPNSWTKSPVYEIHQSGTNALFQSTGFGPHLR